ncbi:MULTISPECIES: tetratricopeptide repeat protein [unclassified Neochlamydia]|uniref:tetratricopeptide repeat protein n=1 Tax=unclassified Neochlamydia TaxID=2643326 RepID=UPI00140763FD|nr:MULTISPECIES: tetratricopeptide repeat protein [unclassified Neochlamydia]MBS4167118.1 Uncharacterized protein [Neochlamydia sp. AcF65]MBS4170265.1 Uncharacterized protein [Neochlamydia sp. AcF95]NGY95576.1 hypothetical protein [Neochlamydia sp. AcF84]
MQQEKIKAFDAKIKPVIEEYVNNQDFHLLATPLKTEHQYRLAFKEQIAKELNLTLLFQKYVKGINLLKIELLEKSDTPSMLEVLNEIEQAFKKIQEIQKKYSISKDHEVLDPNSLIDADQPLWTTLYGLSSETLLLIYELAIKNFNNHAFEEAKTLLHLLLTFSPTVSSYWNAMGYCYQNEGEYAKALNYYLMAEEIDPNFLETQFYLARCYQSMQQHGLALESLEKLWGFIEASPEVKEEWESHVRKLAKEIEA